MQREIDFTKPLRHKENNAESQAIFDGNVDHLSKQCKLVYKLLKQGERLTTTYALINHGIGDLRRRIKDLKDVYKVPGIKFQYVNGRFKEWYMTNTDRAAGSMTLLNKCQHHK